MDTIDIAFNILSFGYCKDCVKVHSSWKIAFCRVYKKELLVNLCKKDCVKEVKYLYEVLNLRCVDFEEIRVYFVCCYNGSFEIMKFMFEVVGLFDIKDIVKNDVLIVICQRGYLNILIYCTEVLNLRKFFGYDPWIHCRGACENGHCNVVKYLFENNIFNKNSFSLCYMTIKDICYYDYFDVVRYMYEVVGIENSKFNFFRLAIHEMNFDFVKNNRISQYLKEVVK